MSQEETTPSLDLIRWTFTINAEHRAEIETHLKDRGLDVLVSDESNFIVTWEEPDEEVDELIEEIWDLNGAPFEVTQEEFHRFGLHVLQYTGDETAEAA